MSFRIMGGRFKGRVMKSGRHAEYRVSTGAVREALFSSLADEVPGSRFLDLFAGCGSVGLEAMSRGSSSVIWVEKVPRLAAFIRQNIAILHQPGALPDSLLFHVERGAAHAVLARMNAAGTRMDIIFADPPYNRDLAAGIVTGRDVAELLSAHGTLVMEHAIEENLPESAGRLRRFKEKRYGNTKLSFFRLIE